jgi:DNA polymerase-3 subunit beta
MKAKVTKKKCGTNTTLTVEARYIAALSLFCGNTDDHECFGGICFEIMQNESRLVATNGHMLAVARIQQKPENFFFPILGMIVPIHLFKSVTANGIVQIEIGDQLVKFGKDGSEILSYHYPVTVTYDGTTISGNSIDTPSPNWRKVIPKKVSGEIAQFNPNYIGLLGKAQETLREDYDSSWVGIGHNGKGPALVEFSDRNFIAVVMPTTKENPSTAPDWCHDLGEF